MEATIQLTLLLLSIRILLIGARTDRRDSNALIALKSDGWTNTPPNWVGTDPCGDKWEGIRCKKSRVFSITLASTNLTGTLGGDILSLTELETLDLSYNKFLTGPLPLFIGNLKMLTHLILVACGLYGAIPDSIGSLPKLTYLALNSNNFNGPIPPSIGNLTNLYWLDLADNKLSGTIPVSNETAPGLDMLLQAKHFHLGKNQLTGSIPPQLFSSSMQLQHVLFDSNQLNGGIPSTLGLVKRLETVRLDRNFLSGPVPSNINNLSGLHELYLSNNNLTGPLPDLTGMNLLNYVDLSNNRFDASGVPPWLATLLSLTTAILRKDGINGTLDMEGNNYNQLRLLDLQDNTISSITLGAGNNAHIRLRGNPICLSESQEKFCMIRQETNLSYLTPPNNCLPVVCSSGFSSPNCECSYPYTGTLVFRARQFSGLGNLTFYKLLEMRLMDCFTTHQLPVDSVSVSNPTMDSYDYLEFSLAVFPQRQESFNRSGISAIAFVFSNQTFKPGVPPFGPYYFVGNFEGIFATTKKASYTGIIIGAVAGGSGLVLVLVIVGVYVVLQRKRAERPTEMISHFESWDPDKRSSSIPQLRGAKSFSFEELSRCTNNFSEVNYVGCGGYGKVYRGTLPNGRLVAIKRAHHGSMQGSMQFKTEIELLSRVHHKNLVSLVGFCFKQDEQILVYEYLPNGPLKSSLSGRSGIRLDWMRRLKIALGSARGLVYLHELADPPIIHRDIKSSNILLDDRLNAKVTDFGLSKLMGDNGKGHITTQVKGTLGYLDPEYYMTNQLTDKSDVYSFGVLMLELITAKPPIERGKYIVREVKNTIDKRIHMYNLQEMLDPAMGLGMPLGGFENFVELALKCVEEDAALRPKMAEVVKEIEKIMQFVGLNPHVEFASASGSSEKESKGIYYHPYNNESLLAFSGGYLPHKVEPK